MIDDIELKITDVIDYVTTIDQKIRSGIIDRFWLADPNGMKSVWAGVRDLDGEGTDVISLKNWKQYLDDGIIKN